MVNTVVTFTISGRVQNVRRESDGRFVKIFGLHAPGERLRLVPHSGVFFIGHLAGGRSLNTSGITGRDMESVVTWRWDYGIKKGLSDIIIQKLFSGRKKNVYSSNL